MYCGGDAKGGIDRIQNEPFYGPSNTVSCCGTCNRMKSSMGSHEFIERIAMMAENMGLLDDRSFSNASIACGGK